MRVIAGPEKKTRMLSEKERLITAYHEMGHAIVAHYLEGCDPVHKISVISRGQALGYTISMPQEDTYLTTRTQLHDTLAMTLGGRAAEELVFDELTTGAANDLEKVTATAKHMIMRFGMSEKLGPRAFGRNHDQPFLGREFSQEPDYSDEIAREIDDEILRIVEEAHQRAKTVLAAHQHDADDRSPRSCSSARRSTGRVPAAARRRERGRGLPAGERRARAAGAAVSRPAKAKRSADPPRPGLPSLAERARRSAPRQRRPRLSPRTGRRVHSASRERYGAGSALADGRPQRHARLVLRRRPLPAGRAALAHGRRAGRPRGRRSSTSAASPRARAQIRLPPRRSSRACCRSSRGWRPPRGAASRSTPARPRSRRRALAAGAVLVNDVTALRGDRAMAGVVAERGADCCLMHMLGEPRTMQDDPRYEDVVDEVEAFLAERARGGRRAGIARDASLLDPGIGFGKTLEHNLALLRAPGGSRARPRCCSASRARASSGASAATRAARSGSRRRSPPTCSRWSAARSVFRVHDVAPLREALAVAAATLGRQMDDEPTSRTTPTS